jgi:hypothetical protein
MREQISGKARKKRTSGKTDLTARSMRYEVTRRFPQQHRARKMTLDVDGISKFSRTSISKPFHFD